jgi:hypothetical protein
MAPRRHFTAQHATILRELQSVLRAMGATGLQIATDYDSHEVTIQFDRAGRRYVYRSGNYAHAEDNLRAAQLTIGYLYKAAEVWGTAPSDAAADDPIAQAFTGYQATPDDSALLLGDSRAPWWEVLWIPRSSDRAAIRNAYLSLARIHHPDAGGDDASFARLNDAYKQALAERV